MQNLPISRDHQHCLIAGKLLKTQGTIVAATCLADNLLFPIAEELGMRTIQSLDTVRCSCPSPSVLFEVSMAGLDNSEGK